MIDSKNSRSFHFGCFYDSKKEKPTDKNLSSGAENKDKSEPHHRVIRLGFSMTTPELWVPTLSAELV